MILTIRDRTSRGPASWVPAKDADGIEKLRRITKTTVLEMTFTDTPFLNR